MSSDFAWIHFGVIFDANTTTATRTFTIQGNPLNEGNGYLLVQARDVESNTHRILINGQNLPDFDLPSQSGFSELWMTWMDRVPHSLLNQGQNTITIRRTGNGDYFRIENVMLHPHISPEG